MPSLSTSDWLTFCLTVFAGFVGWLIAWWFARGAAREAQAQHLEQLERMARNHQQEMDLLRQQNQSLLTHMQTMLHRQEVPGPVARDMHAIPTGRTLTAGMISATLDGVGCQIVGESLEPPRSDNDARST
jgi:hypothetical protein